MDLDLSKTGGYADVGLFKTKGAKCNNWEFTDLRWSM